MDGVLYNTMQFCKYCGRAVRSLYLECRSCECFVHLTCLSSGSTPGGLEGDVFFIFHCHDCGAGGTETFERMKMNWIDVMLLVLYNLTVKFPKKTIADGYYHVDKQIKKFLATEWSVVFPHMKTKRKSFQQMLELTLKRNPQYFKAMKPNTKGRTVWWKLARKEILPNEALLDRKQKKNRLKEFKAPSESESSTDYDTATQDSDFSTSIESRNFVENHLSQINIGGDSDMFSRSYVKPSPRLSDVLFAGEEEGPLNEEDIDIEDLGCEMAVNISEAPTSSSNFFVPLITEQIEETPSESTGSRTTDDFDINSGSSEEVDTTNDKPYDQQLLQKNPTPNLLPWLAHYTQEASTCQPMNIAEELYTLQSLSKKIQQSEAVSVAELRLHRKLAVRRLRRDRNLPVFDIDEYSREGIGTLPPATSAPLRVLDRFVKGTVNMEPTQEGTSFWTRLMGYNEQYSCFTSPFTNRTLKPFIRRDYETQPLWLKLMTELKRKLGVEQTTRSPIDYCYVRPHHIPAVNSLAEQYFWPGINLSECLQYPDFSCVVLYKKLVVAFAFLVPDVCYNEAYISFIFTRPEWQRSGIATFMLYHLIQTCRGRDITLHVSATNPALLLYQKFGFKVESFIQDFYDKYLPLESNACRHALFLRLTR